MIKQIVSSVTVFCIVTCPALAQQDYFQNRSHRTANTTPAIRHANPHTKRVIYHSAKAAGYAGAAGYGMYTGNATMAAHSTAGLYKSTGDAYNANQARKNYVYPKTPRGFTPRKKIKRYR